MRVSRVFTPQLLSEGCDLELEPHSCRRLTAVLRLKPGSPVTLFNGDGHDYRCRLTTAGKRGCKLTVEDAGPEEPRPSLQTTLALGISKGERMDFALQKAVELGVSRIHPLITEFGNQRQIGDWREKKTRHWQNILISACEQSGRRRLPELVPVQTCEQWLEGGNEEDFKLILYPEGGNTLANLPRPDRNSRLHLLVGPEGGLSPNEIELALAKGFQAVRLGPRILRTETAPLAAIAAIQALWGDFR